ncbi:MAG: sigma-70 family RNA polymerase sigma factor [Deltaproteobacteria bacterium]|nr:sigma-70 family RNA polymerase sigma factor [Deltaproteobacteria bacterium]
MAQALDRRSDRELVELCNRGHRDEAVQAFETLYRRHRDYVTRVALRFGADPDAAVDVLQETFLYLLKKFPPTGEGLVLTAQLRSLLYPVAKNLTLSSLRQRARLDDSEEFDPDRLPAPGGTDPAERDPARLSAAVARLPAERREVLFLRFVDDMSLQDIADTLSIPLGTVKSRLHLAVRELRESPEIKDFGKA